MSVLSCPVLVWSSRVLYYLASASAPTASNDFMPADQLFRPYQCRPLYHCTRCGKETGMHIGRAAEFLQEAFVAQTTDLIEPEGELE